MTPGPLGRVAVRVRTRHGRRDVALSCAHGQTIDTEPVSEAGPGAVFTKVDILDVAGLIRVARDEHERTTGCDCFPRLAAALDADR